jgi:site-specific DNA recombinase
MSTTETPIKAALYTRVSTEEQALEGTSLENQLQQVREYCNRQCWQIIREYTDPGFSGKNDDRPGLRWLLSDARNGTFDVVVVSRLDRLSRKLRLLLELEEKLKEYHITLHSVKESVDTSTAIGRTVFQVLGLVAEWERDAIVERTRGGRLQRYKQGLWGPGNVLFGYSYNRQTKKLVINKERAEVVRRVFDLYAAGKSIVAICDVLNAERVSPRSERARGWHSGAIRDIIVNPAYMGQQIVSRNSHVSKLRHGTPEKAIRINIPAIVDNATWESAQRHLSNNIHVRPARMNPWLLQGLVSCGECSHTFRTELTHGKRYYGCTGRLKRTHVDGSSRCTSPRLNADWLEEQVWSRIESILNDPEKLEQLISQSIERLKAREAELDARLRPIDERLIQIAEKKKRLAQAWVDNALGQKEVEEQRQHLEQEETRLRNLRGEVDPAQLEELQQTRNILRFWQNQKASMSWNLLDEDGRVLQTVERPHKTALTLVNLEDKELTETMYFPASRREMLDNLQVRGIVFNDRVEMRAIFPLDASGGLLCIPDYR